MLESLKNSGRRIGRQINRAWESVSEGWNELLGRSGNALTHFSRRSTGNGQSDATDTGFPVWALLAGEMEETGKDVVVRLELPGLDRKDCRIEIDGNVLTVSGEKHVERETDDSIYHVVERAYGSFERSIVLPRHVDTERARADFVNGVLTVRMPKLDGGKARVIPVS
ncbi:MAG: heat-shock protein [Variovorax paradoxus]|nr:MAG: heat-shock protein [Variovorax paradoxus]PZQ04510.1 MAG: heat-shock protein [Variovorax paradoxus]